MSQPTFTPNTAPLNDGRVDWLALGLQAQPGTAVAPTRFLRLTGITGVHPDQLERVDTYMAGSRFEGPAQYAGSDLKMTWTGEISSADLDFLLGAMYNAPVAGVITPGGSTQWAPFFPSPCVCGQAFVATAGTLEFMDLQIMDLTITVPVDRTKNATFSASVQAASGTFHPLTETAFVPVTPVFPAYLQTLGQINQVLTLGTGGTAVNLISDSDLTVHFMNPMDPLPASGEFIPGFAPSTNPIGVEITARFNGTQQTLLAAKKSKVFLDLTWTLGAKKVPMHAQITAYTLPVAPGRVVTDATFRARSRTPGEAPFTILAAS